MNKIKSIFKRNKGGGAAMPSEASDPFASGSVRDVQQETALIGDFKNNK